MDFADTEALRALIGALMNRIEALEHTVAARDAEILRLRDENARLKGEKPAPRFKANVAPPAQKAPPVHRRDVAPGAGRHVEVDEVRTLDADDLPDDARFLGYREVVVQDIVFERHTVRYRLKRYYSPSEQRFFEAPSPCDGSGYGASLRAFVLTAHYQLRIPHQKIVEMLTARGVTISAGTVAAMLAERAVDAFADEHRDIVRAGLATSGFQHIDHTGLRQSGVAHHVAVLCTAAYSAFFVHRYRNKQTVADLVAPYVGGSLSAHVSVLVSDAAGEFMAQPTGHQACWVHEIRHYTTLKGAYFRAFAQERDAFLDRLYAYYARLRRWRAAPSDAEARALAAEFDRLFSGEGLAFDGLRAQIARTRARRGSLLRCLSDARLPLENNEAERSLREVVVKRKISYRTRSASGSSAWSVMLTVVGTSRKQGVEVYAYLRDRLSGTLAMPSLASCIRDGAALQAATAG
jgi:transposase